jgi:hypothetical protein
MISPDPNDNRPPSCRGGRRPGAGAPKGNLNALKHGRRSAQFAELGVLLATIPQARDALLALARRHQLKQNRAEDVANLLLQRLLEHAHQIRNARLNAQSPIDERRTIEKTDADTPAPGYDRRPQTQKHTPHQSDPEPDPAPSIDPQIRKTP